MNFETSELIVPALLSPSPRPTGRGPRGGLEQRLVHLLRHGHGRRVAELVDAELARGVRLSTLCDGPLRTALTRVAKHDENGTQTERATRILLRVLDLIIEDSNANPSGPIAVGGSLSGDPSLMGSRMVAAILARDGIYAIDLGPDTPAESLLDAVEQTGAGLTWVSTNVVTHAAAQRNELCRLAGQLTVRGIHLIVGGRAVDHIRPPRGARVHVGRGMSDVARLALTVLGTAS